MTARSHSVKALRTTLLGALLLLFSLASVQSAQAASPWWRMSSGSRPGNLAPGHASSEVQEIVAEPGTAFELNVGGTSIGLFESEPYPFASTFTEATAGNLQTALEGVYGAGNVSVSGGPGGEAPLVVTSIGDDADKSVAPVAVGVALGGNVEAKVRSQGRPDGQIVLTAANLGDAPIDGDATAVTIADKLPVGLEAISIEGVAGNTSSSPGPVTCSLESLTCTYAGELPPFDQIEIRIGVIVNGASSGESNEASVTGGGAPNVSIHRPIAVSPTPTQFGIDDYELTPEEVGGSEDTQAGSHPFQLTTSLSINQTENGEPAGLPKDMTFKWPPGLIGNPTPFPRCTLGQFLSFRGEEIVNACPAQTAVGVAMVTIIEPAGDLGTPGPYPLAVPIFNLEPARGEPARLGFLAPGTPVVIDASVRTGEDYGITVHTNNISQTAAFLKAEVTVWGAPGEASHNSSRGNGCLRDDLEKEHLPCAPLEEQHPPAFLSLPTSCTGTPLASTVEGDSWEEPHPATPSSAIAFIGPLDGCNQLPFSPSITVAADHSTASTPTGLTVDVHSPQAGSLNANGLAESDVKDIHVALPPGLAINPSAADGLQACSESQVGFTGLAEGTALFTPGAPSCPEASKVGTARITTPVLPNPLGGSVYIAAQDQNPFGSLVAMYVVAEDPISGVLVKLAGKVTLSPSGQIETTFANNPQTPFEDAELKFFDGPRAALVTPPTCGTETTSASFTPWSGNPAALAEASFDITSGHNGTSCPVQLPFEPTLTAGTTINQAAGFSPLTASISREDGNQALHSITLQTPPGLSGILTGVELCPEAQADLGTCGPASLIGETTISVGVGEDPFTVHGGKVYLTGPYQGAPFGLSITTPAKAGPYDLAEGSPCDCIVVRAKVEVNPHTAALTVTTDSSGPYSIPTVLQGIPLEIKHVNATIGREHFTFNPTSCDRLAITASISSAEGASVSPSVPFQASNCAALGFAPKFVVSTSGKTSKAYGASLTTKLSYPNAPQGTQADIAKVKVDLPKQLPSRLSTLQKSCVAAVFEANPAACPASSIVGRAKVITPLLPVPLTGPAYFVSHGGEAFPSLTMVLQGYGVKVELVGSTLIRKGITSTTFNTVPDVPFTTFELTLPEQKFSALAAYGNLCTAKLAMPTAFTAQNGAEIHESTPITATGCKKAKKKPKKKSAVKRKSTGSSKHK
jgi:hypothetical protein